MDIALYRCNTGYTYERERKRSSIETFNIKAKDEKCVWQAHKHVCIFDKILNVVLHESILVC